MMDVLTPLEEAKVDCIVLEALKERIRFLKTSCR